MYGEEVLIDLANADISRFNRKDLDIFLDTLCLGVLHVRPQARHFWDDVGVEPEDCQTDPKTKGTTVVQFLLTSNITIHTLDLLGAVYINIFVCREFDIEGAIAYSKKFFSADIVKTTVVQRQ